MWRCTCVCDFGTPEKIQKSEVISETQTSLGEKHRIYVYIVKITLPTLVRTFQDEPFHSQHSFSFSVCSRRDFQRDRIQRAEVEQSLTQMSVTLHVMHGLPRWLHPGAVCCEWIASVAPCVVDRLPHPGTFYCGLIAFVGCTGSWGRVRHHGAAAVYRDVHDEPVLGHRSRRGQRKRQARTVPRQADGQVIPAKASVPHPVCFSGANCGTGAVIDSSCYVCEQSFNALSAISFSRMFLTWDFRGTKSKRSWKFGYPCAQKARLGAWLDDKLQVVEVLAEWKCTSVVALNIKVTILCKRVCGWNYEVPENLV